jgi:hypothetical protein
VGQRYTERALNHYSSSTTRGPPSRESKQWQVDQKHCNKRAGDVALNTGNISEGRMKRLHADAAFLIGWSNPELLHFTSRVVNALVRRVLYLPLCTTKSSTTAPQHKSRSSTETTTTHPSTYYSNHPTTSNTHLDARAKQHGRHRKEHC